MARLRRRKDYLQVKEVKDIANFFFYFNPLSTVLAFRHVKTDANVVECDEFLKIIRTFLVSTAECVHGFCVLNDICTQERNRICMITCNAALFINVNGPPLSQVDFGKYVHEWIKKHHSATSQDLRNRL